MSIPTPFNPLGTLGALPPGWHYVDSVLFDSNTGARVETGIPVQRGYRVTADLRVADGRLLTAFIAFFDSNGRLYYHQSSGGGEGGMIEPGVGLYWNTNIPYGHDRHEFTTTIGADYIAVSIDGEELARQANTAVFVPPGRTFGLGGYDNKDGSFSARFNGRVWRVLFADLDGHTLCDMRPVKHADGQLAFFDVVKKTLHIPTGGELKP